MNLPPVKLTKVRKSESQYPRELFNRIYRDEDCPRCGFPETITIQQIHTHAAVAIECSQDCGYLMQL